MRTEGYYWVKRKHNQEWIIAQYFHNVADNEPGWLISGSRLVSFEDARWSEIDERRIERREWPTEEEIDDVINNGLDTDDPQYERGYLNGIYWIKHRLGYV